MAKDAYLDIETTGLSPEEAQITLIGIYLVEGENTELVQLYDDTMNVEALNKALEGVTTIYTYNGKRFDLPFIEAKLPVKFSEICPHHDLMFDCWKHNLRGGLKKVEKTLGIQRELTEVNGLVAIDLWYSYKNQNDQKALKTLLRYNEEDVVNLLTLRNKLESR